MNDNQQLVDGAPVRQFEYDDVLVLASDLGDIGEATVDVVDGTVIVATGTDQYDIDVPGGDAKAFIKNGVLTVEVRNDSVEGQE